MLQLELSSSGLLLGLCALSLLIVLLIAGARWYLRKNKNEGQGLPAWSKAKHLAFDPLRHNSAFFQVGLIAALTLTFLAFNWTQQEEKASFSGAFIVDDEFIEMAPPRTTTPPPQVIPPPPVKIEEVPLDELPEEVEEFVDNTINWDDDVILPEPTAKPAPKPAPAPIPVIEDEPKEEIFIRVEKMPVFPGCEGDDPAAKVKCTEQKVMQFIYNSLSYPAIARENGVEGTVVVAFVINEDGKIQDIDLIRDIGAGCGEVTQEAIERLQKKITFTPGMQQSKKVKVRYTVPIKFSLQD